MFSVWSNNWHRDGTRLSKCVWSLKSWNEESISLEPSWVWNSYQFWGFWYFRQLKVLSFQHNTYVLGLKNVIDYIYMIYCILYETTQSHESFHNTHSFSSICLVLEWNHISSSNELIFIQKVSCGREESVLIPFRKLPS